MHASTSSTQCLMNCQRNVSSSSSSTTPPLSKQALRHCFSLVHTGASSTQSVTNNRRRRQRELPPQPVVANSAVLEEAPLHYVNPMRASSFNRMLVEQLRSTSTTLFVRFRKKKLLQVLKTSNTDDSNTSTNQGSPSSQYTAHRTRLPLALIDQAARRYFGP